MDTMSGNMTKGCDDGESLLRETWGDIRPGDMLVFASVPDEGLLVLSVVRDGEHCLTITSLIMWCVTAYNLSGIVVWKNIGRREKLISYRCVSSSSS